MESFSVFSNKSATEENYPYLMDVQSELLSGLETRLVIPLMKKEGVGRGVIKILNPIVRIGTLDYVVLTQQMAAIPKAILGHKIKDCDFDRAEVLGAIDFLVTGI